jgi:hypothetical protein
MSARAVLVASRPGAARYAGTLAALPTSLVGLDARLSELSSFPVKGLGAVRLSRARVEHRGLVDPRRDARIGASCSRLSGPAKRPTVTRTTHLGIANRNEATLSLARASLQDGVLVYTALGLAPLHLAPSSIAPTSEGKRIRVKLPYAGGPVIEGVVDDGPSRLGSAISYEHIQRGAATLPKTSSRCVRRTTIVARLRSGISRARTRKRSSATVRTCSWHLPRRWSG